MQLDHRAQKGQQDLRDLRDHKVFKDQLELTGKTVQLELQDQADPQDLQGLKVLLVQMDKTVC